MTARDNMFANFVNYLSLRGRYIDIKNMEIVNLKFYFQKYLNFVV